MIHVVLTLWKTSSLKRAYQLSKFVERRNVISEPLTDLKCPLRNLWIRSVSFIACKNFLLKVQNSTKLNDKQNKSKTFEICRIRLKVTLLLIPRVLRFRMSVMVAGPTKQMFRITMLTRVTVNRRSSFCHPPSWLFLKLNTTLRFLASRTVRINRKLTTARMTRGMKWMTTINAISIMYDNLLVANGVLTYLALTRSML